MRLYLLPNYNGPDVKGDGGIRRIVEAQQRLLPTYDIHVVDSPPYDCVALHAGDWPKHVIQSGVPIAGHCHGLYWGEYDWSIGAAAVNDRVVHNLLRSDVSTVCSEFVSRAVRKALWIEPTVIYHGVDLEEWDSVRVLAKPREAYILWNKARVDAICDPRPVYGLAALLPDVKFVTTHLVPQVPAPPNVYDIGRMAYDQSKVVTKAADVYLGTTRGTFDISVVEAMACGVPILGWNWGSLPEIVMHKIHGYLAAPDDYEDLAKGYAYIQAHRASMSTACRKRVEQSFTWQHIMKHYADVYVKAVGASTGAA